MGASLPPVGVRFQAQGVPQVQQAFTQIQGAAQRSGQTISRTFVTAQGTVSSFGRQSVQVLNATGFAVSQLAATGKVGFRELSSTAAGFAAFFGPAGLIASGVIALGLVLADFFQRTRKEAKETEDTLKRLVSAADAQRERDEPVVVAEERLATAQRAVAAARAELARLNRAQIGAQIADPGARFELQAKAREALAEAMKAEVQALRELGAAQAKAAPPTEKTTAATRAQAPAAKDAERALNEEISALAALGAAQQLTSADFARALELHRQYATAVRDGTRALLERADALSKERALEGAIAIPGVGVRPGIGTTRGGRAPAGQITINPIAQARLQAPDTSQFATQLAPITTEFQQQLAQGIGTAVATGLAQGFTQGLASGSLTKGVAALGDAMSSALGSVLVQVGTQALIASKIMQGLVAALAALSPWVAIPAALALIALGQTMGAAGRGGIGGGGGFTSTFSGGGGTGGATARRLITDPNALQRSLTGGPVRAREFDVWRNMRPLVLNSPEGQRAVVQTSGGGTRRGVR